MIKIEVTSKEMNTTTQETGENVVALIDRGSDTAIMMMGTFSDIHIMRCLDVILEELCPRLLDQLSEEARMYYHIRKMQKLDEMLDDLKEPTSKCQYNSCKTHATKEPSYSSPGPVGGLDVILNQILKGMMSDGGRKN